MMHAAPGEVGDQGRTHDTAPTPTNAFAPPEAMAAVDAGAGTTSHAAPPPTITAFVAPPPAPEDAGSNATMRPPKAACTDDCARGWQDCKAGHDPAKCDGAYDRCVVGCVSKK